MISKKVLWNDFSKLYQKTSLCWNVDIFGCMVKKLFLKVISKKRSASRNIYIFGYIGKKRIFSRNVCICGFFQNALKYPKQQPYFHRRSGRSYSMFQWVMPLGHRWSDFFLKAYCRSLSKEMFSRYFINLWLTMDSMTLARLEQMAMGRYFAGSEGSPC